MCRPLVWCGMACFTLAGVLPAQQSDQELIRQLMERLADNERRIQALEQKLASISPAPQSETAIASSSASPAQETPTPRSAAVAEAQADALGHNMQIPGGGPTLNIRGFFDFNYGT